MRGGRIRGEMEYGHLLPKPHSADLDGDRILGVVKAGVEAMFAIADVWVVTRMKLYELSLVCMVICDK